MWLNLNQINLWRVSKNCKCKLTIMQNYFKHCYAIYGNDVCVCMTSQLHLTVLNLPVVKDARFQCAFAWPGISCTTQATVTPIMPRSNNISLQCATPSFNILPPIPTGEGTYPSTVTRQLLFDYCNMIRIIVLAILLWYVLFCTDLTAILWVFRSHCCEHVCAHEW